MAYKNLLKTALGVAVGLVATVVPGYSSAFLSFSAGAGSAAGNVVVNGNGSSETLTTLSGVTYNTLVVSNAADSGDNGTWTITGSNLTLSGNTFTLSGAFSSCSGCSAGNLNGSNGGTAVSGVLETFTVSSMLYNAAASNSVSGFNTNTPSQTAFSLFFGTPTSITESSALLSDLGYSAANTTMTSGGVSATGSGTVSSGNYSFGATSETMSLTLVATPEPVSSLLFGSGLIGLAWFARRRSIRN